MSPVFFLPERSALLRTGLYPTGCRRANEIEKQDIKPRVYHFDRGWLDRTLEGYDLEFAKTCTAEFATIVAGELRREGLVQ